ncbi:MAG: aldo/keto reductase [Candidatus Nanohalobium sp.]
MPGIGLGTWQNTDPETCKNSVKKALEIGYSHVDTAQVYDNEQYVGEGLEAADVDREDFFLASKVWIDQLSPENVRTSTERSLEKLGVDKVDLMYVHWPSGSYDAVKTLNAMQSLVEQGMADSIGVSNFTVEQLDKAMEVAGEDIVAHQVEMHPLLQQQEMVEKCREHGIELVAYSPLARGKVMEIDVLKDIAGKHGVSPAQVSLAWLINEKEVKAIPKASSKQHIRENFEAVDLQLDSEDVNRIEGLEREERLIDPGFAPW